VVAPGSGSGQAVHADAPVDGAYVPAGHGSQDPAPACPENVLTPQLVQDELPGEENLPAAQAGAVSSPGQ
jgi:hypothetical protein